MPRKQPASLTIRLARGADRRLGDRQVPPFITEEGLVLVDRRSCGDRRSSRRARKALRAAA